MNQKRNGSLEIKRFTPKEVATHEDVCEFCVQALNLGISAKAFFNLSKSGELFHVYIGFDLAREKASPWPRGYLDPMSF